MHRIVQLFFVTFGDVRLLQSPGFPEHCSQSKLSGRKAQWRYVNLGCELKVESRTFVKRSVRPSERQIFDFNDPSWENSETICLMRVIFQTTRDSQLATTFTIPSPKCSEFAPLVCLTASEAKQSPSRSENLTSRPLNRLAGASRLPN